MIRRQRFYYSSIVVQLFAQIISDFVRVEKKLKGLKESLLQLYSVVIQKKLFFKLFELHHTEKKISVKYHIQGDQQENKSRVLPHLLFYRNVCLGLIVHICILAIHSRFIGRLPLEKSKKKFQG
jgi:hypothetical protein